MRFAVVSMVLLLSLPAISSAAGIKTLNSLSADAQVLATTTGTGTMHMRINSTGANHVFSWDSTPWTVAQGGTGKTLFATGSIPFINAGTFAENNSSLYWDTVNEVLSLGTNALQSILSRLVVKAAPGQAIANFLASSGISQLFIANNGYLGLGTTNPLAKLDIAGSFYSRLVDNSSSPSINWAMGNAQKLTLTSNVAITFVGAQAGGEYTFIVKQDTVGGNIPTWPTNVKWPNDTVPTVNSTPSSTNVVHFVYDGVSYFGSDIKSYDVGRVVTSPPSLTLTPNFGPVFDTVISDVTHSVLICDPTQTCANIDLLSGQSDQCAYAGFNSLAATGGNILQASAIEYTGTPFGPFGNCDKTIPGTWRVRPYLYSGGTFMWTGPSVPFVVTH